MKRVRAAVVLAAGASSRMGTSKALLDLGGRPVVVWHCLRFAEFADRTIVVLGSGASAIREVLPAGVDVVENPDWARTMPADSLAVALRSLDVTGSVLVTPVDVAPAEADTLEALLGGAAPAVPIDADGRAGHPVLLDSAAVAAIRVRAPDDGIRSLLADARRVPVADPLVALDFDDPAAWRRVSGAWSRPDR